jgi:hypothetical protein
MLPAWNPVEIGYAELDSDDPEEQMGSKDKYWVPLPDDERRAAQIAARREQ